MEPIVVTSWAALKLLAVTKQLGLQYVEFATKYEVFLTEGMLVWNIQITKDGGDDVLDFESTYKARSNKPSFFLGQFRNQYRNLTGNGTTVVKSGNGVIRGMSINHNTTGGDIILYDNTAASGTKIGSFSVATPSGGLLSASGQPSPVYLMLTAEFTVGLTVVTSGSSNNDVTIYYV